MKTEFVYLFLTLAFILPSNGHPGILNDMLTGGGYSSSGTASGGFIKMDHEEAKKVGILGGVSRSSSEDLVAGRGTISRRIVAGMEGKKIIL